MKTVLVVFALFLFFFSFVFQIYAEVVSSVNSGCDNVYNYCNEELHLPASTFGRLTSLANIIGATLTRPEVRKKIKLK